MSTNEKVMEQIIENVAKVCHDANRSFCQTLGDNSQPPWEEAPEWQKDSARLGVTKHLTHPMTPEESHQSWSDQKIADGWVYGPVKDPEAKTHPCLVPYKDLPPEQQTKDYLFGGIVAAFKKVIEA